MGVLVPSASEPGASSTLKEIAMAINTAMVTSEGCESASCFVSAACCDTMVQPIYLSVETD